MATPYSAQGPIVVSMSADGLTATARYNGSLAVLATATDATRAATIGAIVTALAAITPPGPAGTGDLSTLPLIFVNELAPVPLPL
jgi:hypothetical protein